MHRKIAKVSLISFIFTAFILSFGVKAPACWIASPLMLAVLIIGVRRLVPDAQ